MTARPRGQEGGHGRLPPVSVIVPARNAQATLPATLDSILAQDYGGVVEVIVADGSDNRRDTGPAAVAFPGRRAGLPNPGGTIPCGLNRALATARHDVIARCDAHSTLPPDYLAQAVCTLLRTGAANIGGRHEPGRDHPFRVRGRAGNAAVRSAPATRATASAAPLGPVDTAFPGVFRRDTLEAAGGWDETLRANEDYALNWVLRERGGIVWFDPALVVDYRPRGDVRGLARQYFGYGRWKAAMLARHPRSLRARQLAAPLLLAALAASGALATASNLAPPRLAELFAAAGAASRSSMPRSCWAPRRDRAAPATHRGIVGAGRGRDHPFRLGDGLHRRSHAFGARAAAVAAPRQRSAMSRLSLDPPRPGAGREPEDAGLTLRTLSGFKWALLTSGGQALLSLAIVMTLSRLLAPQDFGMLAIALVFFALAETAGRSGLGPALVQRYDLTERHIATALTLAVAVAVPLAAALWVLAPLLCSLVGEPQAAPVLKTLSFATALSGAGLVSQHLLHRRLRFGALMTAAILSQAVGTGLVAIALALMDWGVGALVWGGGGALRRVQRDRHPPGACAAAPVRGPARDRRPAGDRRRVLGHRGVQLPCQSWAQYRDRAHARRRGARPVHARRRAGRRFRASRSGDDAGSAAGHGAASAPDRAAAGRASGRHRDAVARGAACQPDDRRGRARDRRRRAWPAVEGAAPVLRILALASVLQAFGALHVPVIRALGAVYRETWRRAVYFVLLMAGRLVRQPLGPRGGRRRLRRRLGRPAGVAGAAGPGAHRNTLDTRAALPRPGAVDLPVVDRGAVARGGRSPQRIPASGRGAGA